MYDPLLQRHPGQAEAYPNSYWASGVARRRSYAPLATSKCTEVAVVGGGYTGLSCAYHLAKRGIEVTLLEANQIGWGCSGRNAGFVLGGTGRLGLSQLQQRFGNEMGLATFLEYQRGVATTSQIIQAGSIECDIQRDGYFKVAHQPRHAQALQNQLPQLQRAGQTVEWLSAAALSQQLGHHNAFGALRFDVNFGLNPLKLALGYADMASAAGASLHSGSAVTQIDSTAAGHRLSTDNGELRATHLVLATNGYSPLGLHPQFEGRILPVLSSVIVTQPYSDEALAQAGLHNCAVVMDTRALKYYYRRLPDNRILFGGRGAISGKHADAAIFQRRLIAALQCAYPQLQQPQVQYSWSGWISVSLDDLPRIYSQDNVHYASGYCGSGVAFASHAGKRLAQRIAGLEVPELPIYQTPLKRFPLAGISRRVGRIGQWGFYQWGRVLDSW